MALIAMAVYDTEENNRARLLEQCLASLCQAVDFSKHRIFLCVNAATPKAAEAITQFSDWVGANCSVLANRENIGTARAVNKAWALRTPNEVCVKMDDDVVFGRCSSGWLDVMEEAFLRDPRLGILGLKRPDLLESANAIDPNWRSRLVEIPHQIGQMDIKVEAVEHVMGTCQGYSPALLAKIGYLYQPGKYGFDDSLSAVRARVAGFYCAFLSNVEIHHIDPGGDVYTAKKRDLAAEGMAEYHRLIGGYRDSTIPIWYGPNGEQDTGQIAYPSSRYQPAASPYQK